MGYYVQISPMYILFSPHNEQTIIFGILFFCDEGEITKHYFRFFFLSFFSSFLHLSETTKRQK